MNGVFAFAGGVCPAAHASDFTWQQLYQCSLFASSLSELMIDQGRDGTEFEKEFDALVAAALNLHRTAYSRERPSARPGDWSSAWEADTSRLEDAFVGNVDASASAMDFLKAGYKECRPEGAYVLMRNRGPTAKD